MKIKHLHVERFRGIKVLDWTILSATVCLVGPGDSTKSTILTAIEYALYPIYNLPIADVDFYDQNVADPIIIELTVSELPKEMLTDNKYGLHLRGWNSVKGLVDEPDDGDEPVISIRLTIDSSLEPVWTVITDRHPEGTPLRAADREKLGATSIGTYLDRHLVWERGSALMQMTGELQGGASSVISVMREAKNDINLNENESWKEICEVVEKDAKKLGFSPKKKLRAAFDLKSKVNATGFFSLHEDKVPLRLSGMANRRLLALSIQRNCAKEGAIQLVDEIEAGLEPHRLRHLLREIRLDNNETGEEKSKGHTFMTTHSSITVVENSAEELHVTRSKDGTTQVLQVSKDLQDIVRSAPEALLGHKIVVGEGATEYGFIRGLDIFWSEAGELPFAYLGVVPVDGRGDDFAPKNALKLAKLGYSVATVLDADTTNVITDEDLTRAGILPIRWQNGKSLEQQIFYDISLECIQKVIDILIAGNPRIQESILDSVMKNMGIENKAYPTTAKVNDWLQKFTEAQIRSALGKTANKNKWFKRIDKGEILGKIIAQEIIVNTESELANRIVTLKRWIYEI